MNRTLTITLENDWKHVLRKAGARAKVAIETGQYQGETLNFPEPALFFSQLTPNRWQMVRRMMGAGVVGVRALARMLRRDVRRVHEDAAVLVELGLLERTEYGALCCPYARIHLDMTLEPLAQDAPALAQAA